MLPLMPRLGLRRHAGIGYTRPDDGSDRFARSRFLRPSARTLHAVLHRDVGALQLLRHARVPHPLHDRAGGGRRARLRRRATRHRSTAPTPAAPGAPRSSAASSPIGCSASTAACCSAGSSSPLGHFTLAFKALPFFYTGLALIVARHRTAQAEREHARRIALRARRRAPRRRLLDLLHGDQPRRVHRTARSPATWRSGSTGTSASRAPASAWRSAWCSTCSGTKRLRRRRIDRLASRSRAHADDGRGRRSPHRRPRASRPRNGSGWARSSSSSSSRFSSGAPTSRPDRR